MRKYFLVSLLAVAVLGACKKRGDDPAPSGIVYRSLNDVGVYIDDSIREHDDELGGFNMSYVVHDSLLQGANIEVKQDGTWPNKSNLYVLISDISDLLSYPPGQIDIFKGILNFGDAVPVNGNYANDSFTIAFLQAPVNGQSFKLVSGWPSGKVDPSLNKDCYIGIRIRGNSRYYYGWMHLNVAYIHSSWQAYYLLHYSIVDIGRWNVPDRGIKCGQKD